MSHSDRPKFAVVREDADLESALVTRTGAKAALVVASGGCTALTLAARFRDLHVAAFDVNPRQLAHVRAKLGAILKGDRAGLNVESADPTGLNQCGEFEGLFRQLRTFFQEFVMARGEAETFVDANASPNERSSTLETWRASRYWPVGFELAFHDSLLHATFGPEATQHAARGSYPGYFQRAFEHGLARKDAATNPFLQHVLLGYYKKANAPAYLDLERNSALELIQGSLEAVPSLGRFSVYSLSNVFDWSNDALARSWAELLKGQARPGAVVLVRQLNNRREVRPLFEPAFRFDEALGARFLEQDRSLFYERILVAFRTSAGT
jgi:S-adenosylmethionine-diacylglycerol 3-amino-3-carboxypropyl transferase